MQLNFNPSDRVVRQAKEAVKTRKKTGEYIEVELAPSVFLVWDAWSDPYIQIEMDSPFYVGDPEKNHIYLNDYGQLGDDIAMLAADILDEVVDEDEHYEFEHDAQNSNHRLIVFHGHKFKRSSGVM